MFRVADGVQISQQKKTSCFAQTLSKDLSYMPYFPLAYIFGENKLKNQQQQKNPPLQSDYKTIQLKHFHLNMHANGKKKHQLYC